MLRTVPAETGHRFEIRLGRLLDREAPGLRETDIFVLIARPGLGDRLRQQRLVPHRDEIAQPPIKKQRVDAAAACRGYDPEPRRERFEDDRRDAFIVGRQKQR